MSDYQEMKPTGDYLERMVQERFPHLTVIHRPLANRMYLIDTSKFKACFERERMTVRPGFRAEQHCVMLKPENPQ